MGDVPLARLNQVEVGGIILLIHQQLVHSNDPSSDGDHGQPRLPGLLLVAHIQLREQLLCKALHSARTSEEEACRLAKRRTTQGGERTRDMGMLPSQVMATYRRNMTLQHSVDSVGVTVQSSQWTVVRGLWVGAGLKGSDTWGSLSSCTAAKLSCGLALSFFACFFTVAITRFSLASFFFLLLLVPCSSSTIL